MLFPLFVLALFTLFVGAIGIPFYQERKDFDILSKWLYIYVCVCVLIVRIRIHIYKGRHCHSLYLKKKRFGFLSPLFFYFLLFSSILHAKQN